MVPNYSVTSATALNLLGTFNNNGNNSRGAFIGGGQIGFNYQISPSFVVGVEADFQGVAGNNNNNNNNGLLAFFNHCRKPELPRVSAGPDREFQQYQQSPAELSRMLRGRVGFLATPSFLIYGTGGLAYGGWRNNNNNFIFQDVAVCAGAGTDCSGALRGNGFNNGNSRVGYTLGGGIEWMSLPNWSVKAEALYYDLGRNNNNNNARLLAMTCNGATCAVPGGLFASSLITQNSNRSNGVIARAGINYHFNWGAPAPVRRTLLTTKFCYPLSPPSAKVR